MTSVSGGMSDSTSGNREAAFCPGQEAASGFGGFPAQAVNVLPGITAGYGRMFLAVEVLENITEPLDKPDKIAYNE